MSWNADSMVHAWMRMQAAHAGCIRTTTSTPSHMAMRVRYTARSRCVRAGGAVSAASRVFGELSHAPFRHAAPSTLLPHLSCAL